MPSCQWLKPRFKRAVIVVIDALRHDFIFYNETAAELKRTEGIAEHYFINKMPTLHRMVVDNNGVCVLRVCNLIVYVYHLPVSTADAYHNNICFIS